MASCIISRRSQIVYIQQLIYKGHSWWNIQTNASRAGLVSYQVTDYNIL